MSDHIAWKLSLERFIDRLERLWPTFDVAVENLVRRHHKKNNEVPSCTTCTEPACCSLSTVVFFFEALPIARRLRREKRGTPSDRDRLYQAGALMESMDRASYFDRQIPCPMLAEKRCSIYDLRPACCRSHVVFTDSKACQPPTGQMVASLNTTMLHVETIRTAVNIQDQLGIGRDPICAGSLPRMVAVALDFIRAATPTDAFARLRREPFPTVETFEVWVKRADNPFARSTP